MEKLIKERLEFDLIIGKKIYNTQHGFIRGRSCTSNLLVFQDSVINYLDGGSSVDIVYLDLKKAFDKVPHDTLIKKIINIGIDEVLVNWIRNWLSDRVQRVGINGVFSDWAAVGSGVPQGSVLGPILFAIFVNDLDEDLFNKIMKFADDTKIWGVVDTDKDIMTMQEDLNRLEKWSVSNKMPFNVEKCKVLHVGKKNRRAKYKLSGKWLQDTKEEKDLGIYFNECFTPSLNCNKVCKAAYSVTGLIRRNILDKSEEALMILYKTLVRPLLDYGIQIWKPYLREDIMQLEKIQKRYTKMINGCKRLGYNERLKKLKITTIEERHNRADLIQVFNILRDTSGTYPSGLLNLSERPGRKNSKQLYKKRVNSELGRHGFTFRSIGLWNALPDQVVTSANVNEFKGRLDHLKGNVGRRA